MLSGCMVNVRGVCQARQQEWITNALLDEDLAELHIWCDAGSVPVTVLSSSDLASFTHVGGEQESLQNAVLRVLEVLDSWSASVTRFVMLLNVDICHLNFASVSLLTGKGTLYKYLGGASPAKTHITTRIKILARYAEQRRRATHPNAAVGAVECHFEEVKTPRQMKGYNFGLFSLALLSCFACGIDMTSFAVNGDQLRISLLFYVVMSGAARGKKRRA